MKRYVFLAIAGIAAVAVGFVAVSIVKAERERAEYAKFRPLPSGPVEEGIYALRDDFVNVFVIKDGNHVILIDAGVNPENVRKELQNAKIDPSAVEHVFLTHSHYDHVAALPLFPNAKIHLANEEMEMLASGKTRLPVAPETLRDGERVAVGSVTLQPIVVSGHTTGSTAYLVNEKVLFTGDTIALKNGRAIPFNEPFNIDTARLRESLPKLARLEGVSRIVTSHYGTSTDHRAAFGAWKP